MAVKNGSLGKTSITAKVTVTGHHNPRVTSNAPGGLYPFRMAAWDIDDYRLANGWPREVPAFDITARTMVSGEAEVLADRQAPQLVTTSADVRWIADEDFYDLIELNWHPYYADAPLVMTATVDHAPSFISDYQYKVGSEIFYANALNFDADSGEYLDVDLGLAVGGAGSYSVILVASLNSVYGNSLAVPYSGLWCPSNTSSGWMSVTLQGTSLYLETDQTPRTQVMSISSLLSSATPLMLAMVFDRPYARFYVATGPSSMIAAQVNTGSESISLDSQMYLGRTADDLLHTADMAVLDLGLYTALLTASQVRAEFASLSSVYGGDK